MARRLEYPFENVRVELFKIPSVDAVSAGESPITFRWLTGKNRYINLGLEISGEKSCEIAANNNSFAVTETEEQEVFDAIKAHMGALKELPDLSPRVHKTQSVTASRAIEMAKPAQKAEAPTPSP